MRSGEKYFILYTAVFFLLLIPLSGLTDGIKEESRESNNSPVRSENKLVFHNETEVLDYAENNSLPGDGSEGKPIIFKEYNFTSYLTLAGEQCFELRNSKLHIEINNCSFEVGDGKTTTVGVFLIDSENITVKNCFFNDFDYSISAYNCNNIIVLNSSCYNTQVRTINFINDSQNIYISNCTFINGKYGPTFVDAKKVEIYNSYFSNFTKIMLSIYDNDKVELRNITSIDGGSLRIWDSKNVKAFKLNLTNGSASFSDYNKCIIENMYLNNTSGFSAGASEGTVYIRNTTIKNGLSNGFGGKVLFENNTITGCDKAMFGGVEYSIIKNNYIYNCYDGIDASFNNTHIINNHIWNIENKAIVLGRSGIAGNNIIENNILKKCKKGLVNYDDDDNNKIRSNKFIDIRDNSINITSLSSEEVLVYNNSFLSSNGSRIKCIDWVGASWDHNGIGNYWSDYKDRYPDALITEQGHWDPPYQIPGDGGSQDNYPLTGITDSDPPTITDRTKRIGSTGEQFQFNFTVEDDQIFGRSYIEEINLRYEYGEVSENVSITPTSEGNYQHIIEIPIDYIGIIKYRITARDIFNNRADSGWYTGQILDTIDPVLNDVEWDPETGESGGSVEIKISYDDNIEVEEVWINGTYTHSGDDVNVNPADIGESQATCNLGIPEDEYSWFNFTVTLIDSRNRFTSAPNFIMIKDVIAPEIIDVTSPDSVNTNESMEISASVEDNIEIGEVYLEYRFGEKLPQNISVYTVMDGVYTFNVHCPPDANGTVRYRIAVNDPEFNWNGTDWMESDIIDTVDPEIQIDPHQNTVFTGGEYTLEFGTSDNVKVERLETSVFQGGNELDFDLGGFDPYSITFTCPVDNQNDIEITLIAEDFFSNQVTETVTVSVVDNIPPDIGADYTITDNRLTIKANITDNIGVDFAYMRIGMNNYTLEEIDGAYRFEGEIDIEEGTYNVLIYGVDINSNMESIDAGEVEITDPEDGSSSFIYALLIAGAVVFIILVLILFFIFRKKKDDNEKPPEISTEGIRTEERDQSYDDLYGDQTSIEQEFVQSYSESGIYTSEE